MTYACPSCGKELTERRAALVCPSCGEYPDRGGFYDFLGDDVPENDSLVSLFDTVSSVYETPVWYPLGMRLATGGSSSAGEIVDRVTARVNEQRPDSVLDIATGTGLFARRLARRSTVYGVDASEEMLRRAVRNARNEGVVLELARADAASLPYADDSFEAATCCGALHLLPSPSETLREAGRVVNTGGTLVVTTLVDSGPFSSYLTRRAASLYGMSVFEEEQLDTMLASGGFERTETERESSLVTVTACRR